MSNPLAPTSTSAFMASAVGRSTRRPSLVEMAELCRAAYGDATTVEICGKQQSVTWRREKCWEVSAFFAALYTREANGRVLAFRGTVPLDGKLSDLVDDAYIAAGGVPATAALALQIPNMVGAGGLYLTGHSLGGALAIIAAARHGLPAVTFNAPGVMDSCLLSTAIPVPGHNGLRQLLASVRRSFTGSRMLNIRIDYDPVSSLWTTGWQAGLSSRVEAAPQCGLNLACRHGIDTCVAAMRQRQDGFEELQI